MRDRFASLYIGSNDEANLKGEANHASFYGTVKGRMGLGLLFPVMGVPLLMISIVFASTRAQDAWILENILPAFIIFSFLLGISLFMGQSGVAELNAAIALGVLAIIPSVKYGFVYGVPDEMGHYSTGVEIARTGSLAGVTFYSQSYAPTPLMHILEAATALTLGLPVDAVMALALFLEHFVIFLLVVESARRMFPRIDRRLIVFLALITVPVLPYFGGTTYGLLPLAMLTYVFSRIIRSRSEVLLATTLMLLMVVSHFVTTVYFLIALAGYGVSLLIVRFGTSISTGKIRKSFEGSPFFNIVTIPLFFAIFLLWLMFVGGNYFYYVHLLTFEFTGAPALSSVGVPLFDTVLTILYADARFIFSGLMVLVASSIGLIRHRKTGAFIFRWWLFASGGLMGAAVGLGYYAPQILRFASYVSMLAPYFACFLISRQKSKPWLLNTSQVRAIKVAMLAALVLSMIAVYPMSPLYPKWTDGKPVLEDGMANTIYCISGVKFLDSFFPLSSPRALMTTETERIFADMYSLDPRFTNLDLAGVISTNLDSATSLSELRNHTVAFDVQRSGRLTLRMRTVVLPLLSGGLRDTLGLVYSNGFFYVAIGPS